MELSPVMDEIVVNATVAVVQNSSNATAQALAVQHEMLDMLYFLMLPFLALTVITFGFFVIMCILDDDDDYSSYHYHAASNQESQQHREESVNKNVVNQEVVADTSNYKGDVVSQEEEPRSRWDSLEI